MFTGIVTDLGSVRAIEPAGEGRDLTLVIATAWKTEEIPLGASIACNGCCLTVVEKGPGTLAFTASAETLDKTTIGRWRPGSLVNLERALRMGDELGGHLVTGHIDGVGRVAAVSPEGGSLRLTIRPPPHLMPMLAPKGSVAVDGVSLTINNVDADAFGVNIIPHTAKVTTLGRLKPGDPVNIEVDLVARYLARLFEARGR